MRDLFAKVVPVKHIPDANFLSRSVRQRICNGARQPAFK